MVEVSDSRPDRVFSRKLPLLLVVVLAGVAWICTDRAYRGPGRSAKPTESKSAIPVLEDNAEKMPPLDFWFDAVTYHLPADATSRSRMTRAADWLKEHLIVVPHQSAGCKMHVIAWKDPTLEPSDPRLMAGYLITDSLWAAKALRVHDPQVAQDIETGLYCCGWYGNGLQDVLFHRLDTILHRPADEDFVHGYSLGRFPMANGNTVDVRVFRQKRDADFNVGHPRLFAEHAIYEAMYDFWNGRTEQARQRVLNVVDDRRSSDSGDRIFWDRDAGILVDYVNLEDWIAFHRGDRSVCRHSTFKLGVLLYAIRVLALEERLESLLPGMHQRLWDAQHETGGVAHFVDVAKNGAMVRGAGSTGEATAIAILVESVDVQPAVVNE